MTVTALALTRRYLAAAGDGAVRGDGGGAGDLYRDAKAIVAEFAGDAAAMPAAAVARLDGVLAAFTEAGGDVRLGSLLVADALDYVLCDYFTPQWIAELGEGRAARSWRCLSRARPASG